MIRQQHTSCLLSLAWTARLQTSVSAKLMSHTVGIGRLFSTPFPSTRAGGMCAEILAAICSVCHTCLVSKLSVCKVALRHVWLITSAACTHAMLCDIQIALSLPCVVEQPHSPSAGAPTWTWYCARSYWPQSCHPAYSPILDEVHAMLASRHMSWNLVCNLIDVVIIRYDCCQ